MENERIAEKWMYYLENNKLWRYNRLFNKHKNNEELWDILLQNETFTAHYLVWQPPENMDILSLSIQKKILNVRPELIRFASNELRDDKDYMESLQRTIDSRYSKDEDKTNVFDYLGPKLANDIDYLLSIQDKCPTAFIRAMKEHNFDEKIVKDFFNRYPAYVKDLPDNLKYDYEYAASLIEQLPPEFIELYLGDIEYDYLKNDIIKNAIINVSGEKTYNKVLLVSIAEYPETLKRINPEEFGELILLAPDIFLGSFGELEQLASLISSGPHRENMNLIQKIINTSKVYHKQINTPQKLSNILYDLAKATSKGLTLDEISEQIHSHWKEVSFWIEGIDEFHTMNDGSMSHTEDCRCFYTLHNLLIGIENKKLEDMFKIFYNAELRTSPYASGIKDITITKDNLSFLQFICSTNLFTTDIKTLDTYNKLFLKITYWNSDPYMALEIIERISKNEFMQDIILNTDIDSLDQDMLINLCAYINTGIYHTHRINNLDELKNYKELIDKFISNFEALDITDMKNKVLIKHFEIDANTARVIIHSYLSSDIDPMLYKNMPEVKYLKDILESIINSSDMSELVAIDNSLSNNTNHETFKDIYEILNSIKCTYGRKINNSLLQVNSTSHVIDATDLNFNLLVHVIGAYGSVPIGDVYDSWNTLEKSSTVSICTSFISENNMGIAPTSEQSVILGFNNLPDNYLEIMSCHDLYSHGFRAHRSSRFLTPEELKNNTRHGHNEIVIRRRKGEFSEEKLQPSYIICFDSINENSKLAAKKFDIPIIFIDREKIASRKHDELVEMVKTFEHTLNPQLIEKIICEQENNKAGLRLIRLDLVDKYFSTAFRQKNIQIIFSIIEKELNNNNQRAIALMNEFVRAINQEVDKFKITKETPHRKNTFDIEYEELLEKFKSHLLVNEKIQEPKKLTPEELYERFIKCRAKVIKCEIEELRLLNEMGLDLTDKTQMNMKVG